MKFLKLFKEYFVPHEENGYHPRFLRKANILFFSFLIIFFFASSLVQTAVITRTDLLSAILPGVLADLANKDRATNGLVLLRVSPVLSAAAQAKANDMAARGYFAHTSPNGATPWYWMQKAGYSFFYAGENLAVNFSDSGDVDRAWMNSPAHRANILNFYFTEIGIAMAKGIYQGRETTFVVQMFGTPAPLSIQPSQNPPPLKITPKIKPTPVKLETAHVGALQNSVGDNFEIVVSDDTFIAVKNTNSSEKLSPAFASTQASPQSSWFARIITSPQRVLMTVYLVLEAIIISALIIAISREVRKLHPLHILYGLFLLVLMSGVVYVGQSATIVRVLIL